MVFLSSKTNLPVLHDLLSGTIYCASHSRGLFSLTILHFATVLQKGALESACLSCSAGIKTFVASKHVSSAVFWQDSFINC